MLTEFGSNIDKYLQQKAQNDDRDYSYLHPSDFGGCSVATWFKTIGEKPLVPPGATQIRLFDNGHYVHLRNQVYAKEAGCLAKDKIASIQPAEEIVIGLQPKQKMKVEGESGRVYYYSPGEIIWRVEKNKKINKIDIDLGTDSSPYWDFIENLQEGDEWWMVEVPVVNTEYHFGGHCDAIVVNDGKETVIDYKGVSDYSWGYIFRDEENTEKYLSKYPDNYNSSCIICGANMRRAKDLCQHLTDEHIEDICLDFKYKVQLHVYMMILNIDQAMLWYENKNNQIVIDYLVQKDEELINRIQKNANQLWNKVLNKEQPKRNPKYVRTSMPCKFCDFASQCWNN